MTDPGCLASSRAASDSRGWRCYTPLVLLGYDWWVHRISNQHFWRCPFPRLVEPYDRFGGKRHLEIGVGTGLPLLRSVTLPAMRQVTLLDANPRCLATTAGRLRRQAGIEAAMHAHDLARADVDPLGEQQFDSIGMTYLLHCLPVVAIKSAAITLAARHLALDGTLFGATLLGVPSCENRMGRMLESWYQRRGIFGNQGDDRERIESMLREAFCEVQVEQIGRALLFVARDSRLQMEVSTTDP